RLGVHLRRPPGLRLLVRRELEQHHTLRLPRFSLELLGAPAASDVAAAVLLDGDRRKLDVLGIAVLVVHVHVDDDVRLHASSLPVDAVPGRTRLKRMAPGSAPAPACRKPHLRRTPMEGSSSGSVCAVILWMSGRAKARCTSPRTASDA